MEANISISASVTLGEFSTAWETSREPSRTRIKRSSLLPFMANWMRWLTFIFAIFCRAEPRSRALDSAARIFLFFSSADSDGAVAGAEGAGADGDGDAAAAGS